MNTSLIATPFSRRQFITRSAYAATAGMLGNDLFNVRAEEPSKPAGETLVTQLYKSMTEDQRKAVCFPYEHPLRHKVDNNWHITNSPIGKLFSADQVDLIKQIFDSLPALSLPCGFATETGKPLPIGMQLVGKPLDEATILRAAWAYEQATDWHKTRAG